MIKLLIFGLLISSIYCNGDSGNSGSNNRGSNNIDYGSFDSGSREISNRGSSNIDSGFREISDEDSSSFESGSIEISDNSSIYITINVSIDNNIFENQTNVVSAATGKQTHEELYILIPTGTILLIFIIYSYRRFSNQEDNVEIPVIPARSIKNKNSVTEVEYLVPTPIAKDIYELVENPTYDTIS